MDKVTVYQDESGEYRWRRQSENGQIVSTSGEGYSYATWAREQAVTLNPDCELEDEA